jgi:hypothetical protein
VPGIGVGARVAMDRDIGHELESYRRAPRGGSRARRGLIVTCVLLLCVLLAWGVSSIARSGPAAARPGAVAAHSGAGAASAASATSTGASRIAQAADGACPERFGSYAAGSWPAACWRPYASSSPFNVPIPANPRVSRESGAIVSFMASQHWGFQNQHGAFTIWPAGSRPVYWARASDPVVTVSCRGYRTCQGVGSLHMPRGAAGDRNSDGHLTVVDQSRRVEYDFWQASGPYNGVLSASAASAIALGPNTGTGIGGRAEAADLGLLGGLLRGQELQRGSISHALATTVECVQWHDVWPSPPYGRGDDICPGGQGPHFGSLLQLNMSAGEIAATHAPAWQRAVMTAMARYGIYVVDTNGSHDPEMNLIAESDLSYRNFGAPGALQSFLSSIGSPAGAHGVPIDTSRLRVIEPCVKQRTC